VQSDETLDRAQIRNMEMNKTAPVEEVMVVLVTLKVKIKEDTHGSYFVFYVALYLHCYQFFYVYNKLDKQ
jgi:hypothetical protein